MSNTDTKTRAYFDRALRLENERREVAESIKDFGKEMRGVLTPDEIAGIKLAVKRSFETEEKRVKRESAEEVAASLGHMVGTPLGDATIHRHAHA